MLGACCGTEPFSLARMAHALPMGPVAHPALLGGLVMADTAKRSVSGLAKMPDYRQDSKLPSRGHFIIRNALSVMSMDPQLGDIAGGDVHVKDGVIVAVGQNLKADGAEVIDASGAVVLPGFIDTHWHLWNSLFRGMVFFYGPDLSYFPMKLRVGKHYTPTDMYRAVQMGLAEALSSGITTVNNWAHNIVSPEHADANILAQMDTGVRGRFSYGYREGQPADTPMDLVDVARVQQEWFGGKTGGMLDLGVALRGPENMPFEHTAIYTKEIETARKLGIPITIHVAQHHAGAMKSQSIPRLTADKLLGPDLQLVHAIHASPADIAAMGESGTKLSLSPLTELQTGMGFPLTSEMMAAGVLVSLSIDTIAVTNADMFATMRSLADADNARLHKRALEPRKMLEMATVEGARDLGISNKVGSLVPGKRADIQMVRMDEPNTSTLQRANWAALLVRHAQPSNIDTVIVDGRILKRHGKLTALDTARVRYEAAQSSAELMKKAGFDA